MARRILVSAYLRTTVLMRTGFTFAAVGLGGMHPLAVEGQVAFQGTQISLASGTFLSPSAVAVDGHGNVYVADTGNNRIVSLASAAGGPGVPVTILAGLSAPQGIAADWSGNVFVADTGNNRVLMLSQFDGVFGSPVTISSGLNGPMGVAVDSSDNVYVADTGNNRAIELPNTGAGYGSAQLLGSGYNAPAGIAVDTAGNLYICDTGNERVLKQTSSQKGLITQQIFGKGLNGPVGIAVDRYDNLYVADGGNSRIVEFPWNAGARRYNTQSTVGSGFSRPVGVVADWQGNIYTVDSATGQVNEVEPTASPFGGVVVGSFAPVQTYNLSVAPGTTIGSVLITTQGASGMDFVDGGNSTCLVETYRSQTTCGVSVLFGPLGSGSRQGAVTVLDNFGNTLATAFLAGMGIAPLAGFIPGATIPIGSQLSGPQGVAVDGSGNVYVADTGNNRVVEIPWNGSGYGAETAIPFVGLLNPTGVGIDGSGSLYVVSNGNDKVLKLPWIGSGFGVQSKIGNGLYGPSGVAVDGSGDVFIADTLDNQLDKLPWTGSGYLPQQSIGNYRKFPTSVAVDGSGNVYFAEPYIHAVIEVPWSGTGYLTQLTIPLDGVLFPAAVTIDGNSNLYVVDTGNNRVVMLPWSGSGFGEQITVASGFNAPLGIAVDSMGSIYVADTGNNQVVKVDFAVPGTLSFPNTYLGSTSQGTATVENLGNQSMALTSIVNPPDFPAIDSGTAACAVDMPITRGGSCALSIDFAPLMPGPISESLLISESAGTGASVAIPLSGIALNEGAQSITFPSLNNVVYGAGPIALRAVASSHLPVSYQIVSGPAALTVDGSGLIILGAGTVQIEAMQNGNATFAPAEAVTQQLVILPATLTVTPLNVNAVYGAIPSSFNYSVTGFVSGQNAANSTSGSALIVSAASSNSGVGSYAITASQGTLIAANYVFVFMSGTLTINPAPLVVKAFSYSIMYGSSLPFFHWCMTGFVNGDTQAIAIGSPSLTSIASASSPVGTYPILVSAGSLLTPNYRQSFVSGNVVILKAVLTIQANSASVIYGAPLPEFSYTLTGFVNGDSVAGAVTGAPQITTKASSNSPAGVYEVGIASGTLIASNYCFRFKAGNLTIRRAPLTVIANSFTMNRGSSPPTLTFALSGLVAGDSAASAVQGAPLLSTKASAKSKDGSYAIVTAMGDMTSMNYQLTLANGTATVVN